MMKRNRTIRKKKKPNEEKKKGASKKCGGGGGEANRKFLRGITTADFAAEKNMDDTDVDEDKCFFFIVATPIFQAV